MVKFYGYISFLQFQLSLYHQENEKSNSINTKTHPNRQIQQTIGEKQCFIAENRHGCCAQGPNCQQKIKQNKTSFSDTN